mgnify:CR=1 FL=1
MTEEYDEDISVSIHVCCCFLSIFVCIIIIIDYSHPVTIVLGVVFYIVVFLFICVPPCFYYDAPFSLTGYFCYCSCKPFVRKSVVTAKVVPIPLAIETHSDTEVSSCSFVSIKPVLVV